MKWRQQRTTSLTKDEAKPKSLETFCFRYRLAPEHPYPAAVEDCAEATKYLVNNAAEFEVNPNRIAVAGWYCGNLLASGVHVQVAGFFLITRWTQGVL